MHNYKNIEMNNRDSPLLTLPVHFNQVFVFHEEGFRLPMPSHCWEIIENTNTFLCPLIRIQYS